MNSHDSMWYCEHYHQANKKSENATEYRHYTLGIWLPNRIYVQWYFQRFTNMGLVINDGFLNIHKKLQSN